MSSRYEIRREAVNSKLKIRGALLLISFLSLLLLLTWFIKVLYGLRLIPKAPLSDLYQGNRLFQLFWDGSPPAAPNEMLPFGLPYIVLLIAALVVPLTSYLRARREKSKLDSLQREAENEMDKEDYKRNRR